MAKRNIVFIPGHYYHIYNRGANRGLIFRNQENYDFLLRRIREYSIRTQATIVVYCLMPNHYHFLIRQDSEKPVSEFVQGVFNSYTKAFNKMYNRTGTLFEGPYQAIVVEKYEYLLHLCRYIHRNPLDAGLVTHPADWKYSNYLEWVRKRSGIETNLEFIIENFPNPLEYEEFVLNYIPPDKTEKGIKKLSFE